MNTTSISLLEQPAAGEAWARFVELYTPLLYLWARRLEVPDQEAADLLQDVLTVLVQKLPEFAYNPHKRFRGWLWTILVNKVRDRQRRERAAPGRANAAGLDQLPAPASLDSPPWEEAEYRQHHSY